MKNVLSDIIAERELDVLYPDGREELALFRIFRPVVDPTDGIFQCYWQATVFGTERTRHSFGEDSVQAIIDAFEMIGIDIEAWQIEHGVKFSHAGGPHGFPTTVWDSGKKIPESES